MAKTAKAIAEPVKESSVEVDESQILTNSIEWIVSQVQNHRSCPFCGWQALTDSDSQSALEKHLRVGHPVACMKANEQKTLSPMMRDEVAEFDVQQLISDAGVEVEDLGQHDLLFVEQSIRDKAKADGKSLRWCSPEKVGTWLQRGAELIPLGEDTVGPHRAKTEDGTTRAREMVLVSFPPAARKHINAQKQSRIVRGVEARREDVEERRGAAAKHAFDSAVQGGLSRQQAKNIADSIERGTSGHLHINNGR